MTLKISVSQKQACFVSALCFATWNSAVKLLRAVKTSVYIYLVPVITVAASFLILHEPLTWATCAGTILTLGGLLFSKGP
ncbi:MAG TPA: DMT family transporter [Candidatus Blautia excrementipullorum]|nr:DMT family transporter [Candidatus Blautia excrementipullorum]